jgi:predicted metal-dependent phosphoesterase TrpH
MGRADLHLHTCFSDGRPTPTEVVFHVLERTDIDVVAITDHDAIEGALRAAELGAAHGLEVIVGEEVSSRDGHILGLFLTRRVRPGMSAAATVHAIHAQDGLAIAAHPFWRSDRQRAGRVVHGVGWRAAELDFDGVEVENATPGLYLFNQMAHRLALSVERAAVGGSDAHILEAIGRARTVFRGRTARDLRKSLIAGATRSERQRYSPLALARYAAFGLNYRRQRLTALPA